MSTESSRQTGRDGREHEPITEPQRKRLFAILKSAGRTDVELKAWMAVAYNLDSTKKITRGQYDAVIQAIETPGPLGAPADRELAYEREPGSDDA